MSANDQAVKWAKAKVRVCADSVLCVGQVKDISGATERWQGQVEHLKMYSSYRDAVGLDGESIEIEWNIFPGFSSLSLLREIQNDLETKKIRRGVFKQDIGRFWVQYRKNSNMAIPMINRTLELHRQQDGTPIQRDWSFCLQK